MTDVGSDSKMGSRSEFNVTERLVMKNSKSDEFLNVPYRLASCSNRACIHQVNTLHPLKSSWIYALVMKCG
jgi:hypothetical protein